MSLPAPGTLVEVAAVRVAEIRRQRDGGWFAGSVVIESGPAGQVGRSWPVAGVVPGVMIGRHYACTLEYMPHPSYGPQWTIRRAVVTTPQTTAGLARFLQEHVTGIGPTLAARLIDTFGTRLDAVLGAGDALEQVRRVKGVTRKVGRALVGTWRRERERAQLDLLLYEAGWTPNLIGRARETFGEHLPAVVATEPYRLLCLRGVGFAQADRVATTAGLAADAPQRLVAAACHLLGQAAELGHCWTPLAEILAETATLLALPAQQVEAILPPQLTAAASPQDLVHLDEEGRCWLPWLWAAQQQVAQAVALCLRARGHLPPTHSRLGPVAGPTLTPEQADAVAGIPVQGLAILTGGPGTGKTTVVRALLRALCEHLDSPRIALAAPTGKAARRLSESTGGEALTIHRLLEWNAAGPQRTADRPVAADVVVVDEASMLDLELAAALFAGLPPACRVILVGDVDQLPSVGPGQVLHDLIAAGVPTWRLTTVHRQAGDSLIIHGAHAIKRGDWPEFASAPGRELYFIEESDAERIAQRVLRTVADDITTRCGIPADEVRVLIPNYRGACGIDALNERLRERLNPPDATKAELTAGKLELRVGDRLVWLSNQPDLDLVNGSEVLVLKITSAAVAEEASPSSEPRQATGTQAERIVILVNEDGVVIPVRAHQLHARMAYALSVHKSQGSEYPAVVMVLHPAAGRLLERRLLYTAVTRAKRLCVLIGDRRALQRALANTSSGERRTGLDGAVATAMAALSQGGPPPTTHGLRG